MPFAQAADGDVFCNRLRLRCMTASDIFAHLFIKLLEIRYKCIARLPCCLAQDTHLQGETAALFDDLAANRSRIGRMPGWCKRPYCLLRGIVDHCPAALIDDVDAAFVLQR